MLTLLVNAMAGHMEGSKLENLAGTLDFCANHGKTAVNIRLGSRDCETRATLLFDVLCRLVHDWHLGPPQAPLLHRPNVNYIIK